MASGILSLNCLKISFTLICSMLAAMTRVKLPTVSQFKKLSDKIVENAKLFKEDLLRRNVKNSSTLNLQSLRLGINAIIALSNAL